MLGLTMTSADVRVSPTPSINSRRNIFMRFGVGAIPNDGDGDTRTASPDLPDWGGRGGCPKSGSGDEPRASR